MCSVTFVTLPRLNSTRSAISFALRYFHLFSKKILMPLTARQRNYRYHRPLRAVHYLRWCQWWLQSFTMYSRYLSGDEIGTWLLRDIGVDDFRTEYQSTRRTVNSSHGQLVMQSTHCSQLVTTLNYVDGQLITRATLHNSLGVKLAHMSVGFADTHTRKPRNYNDGQLNTQ